MLHQDLRYVIRTLLKTPGFTFVAVLSLALAIGATAAGVSILNALFARELAAVQSPSELVALSTINPDRPDDRSPLLLAQIEEVRARSRGFSQVFAWRDALLRNVEVNGETYLGNVNEVSDDYFEALGVQPLLGRVLTPADVASIGAGTSARVAVLDYRCWEQRFGRDPNVLGQVVAVDGTPLTIVGVMPENFTGLNIVVPQDATVPIGFDTGRIPDRATAGVSSARYYAAARLARGTSADTAAAYLTSIWPAILDATIPQDYQEAQRTQFLSTRIELESLRTGSTGSVGLRRELRRPLQQLLGLSGVVLLVAFLNLAGLILTRAAARQQELGLRASLGAGRLALMRIGVLEAVLVSAAGALLGLAAAFWTGPLLLLSLLRFRPFKPLVFDATPDLWVLSITVLTALGIAVVCSLVPGWRIIGRNPVSALHPNTRGIRGVVTRLQKAVICSQVSLAFVLTTGALLFGRTLYNLYALDPGFRVDHVLTLNLFPEIKQQIIPNSTAYHQELAEALSAIPGVESASYARFVPLHGSRTVPVSGSRSGNATDAVRGLVGPGFFHTMGITVVAGREFDWHDDEHAPRVAIVSQSLADRLFPQLDPIGQTIDIPRDRDGKGLRIVGVVNSARLWEIQHREPRAVYVPLMQQAVGGNNVAILHTAGDVSAVARAANQVVESRRYEYSFMTQSLNDEMKYALRDERVLSFLSAFFAGLTIVLAAAGLYGLLSYAVTRRSSEIGLRLAIGAQPGDIQLMMLRGAARLVVLGLAIGVPVAIAGVSLASDVLFGLAAYDPLTFVLSAIVLAAVTLIAAYFPARRASHIDPLLSIRTE